MMSTLESALVRLLPDRPGSDPAQDRRPVTPLRRLVIATLVALVVGSGAAANAAQSPTVPTFAPPQTLPGASGGTEPRIAVTPDGTQYVIVAASTDGPSSNGGRAVVYASRDHGRTWRRTGGLPAGQMNPSADVDLVATASGRLVAVELDSVALSIVVSYSDDGGRSWTGSAGFSRLVDQDRPWLAAGPADRKTGRPRVYLFFHNGFSSNLTHNMFVETSSDNGATFGPPVPITAPASPAWLDLQCGGASGPSGIAVNQTSGRLYAFWATRHGLVGNCGALPLQPYTFVTPTRVWSATSPDGSLGSWTDSLAVDDAGAGNVVGMTFTPGAVDHAGNVYVVYTESPHRYPDLTGAAIRVRHARPSLKRWSRPITIARQGKAGNVLPHIVAGDTGKIDVAYFAGVTSESATPRWFATVAQVLNGTSDKPIVTTERISDMPTYKGTASQLMLVCDGGPAGVIANNPITCTRSTDDFGIALDGRCNLVVSWPSVSAKSDPRLGAIVDATWVDTQVGGPGLCTRRTDLTSPGGRAF
jgi:hypothetical protein